MSCVILDVLLKGFPCLFCLTYSQHRIAPIQGEGGQGPVGSHISESSWKTCLVEAHPLREKYESNMGAAFDVVVAMKEHQPESSSRDWPQVPQFFPSFLGPIFTAISLESSSRQQLLQLNFDLCWDDSRAPCLCTVWWRGEVNSGNPKNSYLAAVMEG